MTAPIDLFDNTAGPILADNGQQAQAYNRSGSTQNRNLSSAFTSGLAASAVRINGDIAAVNAAPSLTSSD